MSGNCADEQCVNEITRQKVFPVIPTLLRTGHSDIDIRNTEWSTSQLISSNS